MSCLNKSLFGLVAISATATSSMASGTTSASDIAFRNGSTSAPKTPSIDKSKRSNEAKNLIRSADIICFDVDSTVIKEEGIDELAAYCDKGQEVSALTRDAMAGSMTFQEALKRRLDIIKPSQTQISDFLQTRPSTLSPGIREFVQHLKANNKKIYLISGGFDCLIEPVANQLAIPISNVFANKLLFDFKGNYAGFDTTQPTSRSGGKGEAIEQVLNFNRNRLMDGNNELKIVMIGDGSTDLEATENFIGYGGNIIREPVHEKSHYYIIDFGQLM